MINMRYFRLYHFAVNACQITNKVNFSSVSPLLRELAPAKNEWIQNFKKRYSQTYDKKHDQLVKLLQKALRLPCAKVLSLIDENSDIVKSDINNVDLVIKLCKKYSIDEKNLKENLFLIKKNPVLVEEMFVVLSTTNLNINDGVPFLNTSLPLLIKLCNKMNDEISNVPNGNRLYFLSEKMKVDPYILAKTISKQLFVYHMSFDKLKKSLKILLEMGVTPDNIMKDISVFRYKPEVIKSRLLTIKNTGREKLMPWMVKCGEKIFERSMKITVLMKKILGKNKSTSNYLAEKLACSNDVVNRMASHTPYIRTMRVTKVQTTLDFLFREGYQKEDVLKAPRVFAHSVKTMEKRLHALRSVGVNPTNLNVLCKSKSKFDRYLFSLSKTSVIYEENNLQTKN